MQLAVLAECAALSPQAPTRPTSVTYTFRLDEETFNERYMDIHDVKQVPEAAWIDFTASWAFTDEISTTESESSTDSESETEAESDEAESDEALQVYNDVDNEEGGERFEEYCDEHLSQFKNFKYFQTFGGGPEGGFIMERVGEHTMVSEVERSWFKPFTVTKTYMADVTVEWRDYGFYITVKRMGEH